MGTHMKTTIEIADPLLKEARALARREGTTLKALVEEGLKAILGRRSGPWPPEPRDGRFGGSGLTPEFEAKGGWDKLREAAYPGFFDDEEEDDDK
jgi:hypothetical protein